ncbi:hypothetical protein [Spirosoma koreense]
MVEIREKQQKQISQPILNQVFVRIERSPADATVYRVEDRQNRQGHSDQYFRTV